MLTQIKASKLGRQVQLPNGEKCIVIPTVGNGDCSLGAMALAFINLILQRHKFQFQENADIAFIRQLLNEDNIKILEQRCKKYPHLQEPLLSNLLNSIKI